MGLGVMLLGLAGCHVGPSTETFAPATGPEGIRVDLRLGKSTISGELLEVQDSALLVLDNNELVLVRLADVALGAFRQRGVLIERGAIVGVRTDSELRLLSRYPAGLAPGLRARILAVYGQTEPRRAAP